MRKCQNSEKQWFHRITIVDDDDDHRVTWLCPKSHNSLSGTWPGGLTEVCAPVESPPIYASWVASMRKCQNSEKQWFHRVATSLSSSCMNSTDASISTWSIRTGAVIVYDEGLVIRPRMVGTCREVLRVVYAWITLVAYYNYLSTFHSERELLLYTMRAWWYDLEWSGLVGRCSEWFWVKKGSKVVQ